MESYDEDDNDINSVGVLQGSIFSSEGGISTWWAVISLPGNFPYKYGILIILKIIFIKFE